MYTFVDTHTHLYAKQFDADRDAVMQAAIDSGVAQFFLPNIDSKSIARMFELEQAYPERCYAMMGLHPCSVKEDYKEELDIVRAQWASRDFCAVGEIGLDYYWSMDFVEAQKDAFLTQCAWAQEYDRPIVIHARESIDDLIALVKQAQRGNLRGIFHCFTGTEAQAKAITDLGFYLGVGGVLTFKNAGLDKVIKTVDLAHLVLETDAPYLAPKPYRGKRNESSYVPIIGHKLAEVLEVSIEEVAAVTTANARAIFEVERLASRPTV